MEDFRNCIHPLRRSVPTPASLVGEDGQCAFGTFDREFESFHLLRAKHATVLPRFLNRTRLTLWEACEIMLPGGIILAAVCDMSAFGRLLVLWYDAETNGITAFDQTVPASGTHIAPNLLHGAVTHGSGRFGGIRFENRFDEGKARLTATLTNKNRDALRLDFSFTRVSLPSVVSIPFGPNRPLYTQKDLLRAEGALTLNGRTVSSDGNTAAVIDDHRGYYPRRMHYDWASTMVRRDSGGAPYWFGLNLTQNQSTDPEAYNENLIWLTDRTSLLPPVTFRKVPPMKDFVSDSVWTIRDGYGMVDADFRVTASYPILLHAGVVSTDYYITFGSFRGSVRCEDGTVLSLDGLPAIGEDKTMLY